MLFIKTLQVLFTPIIIIDAVYKLAQRAHFNVLIKKKVPTYFVSMLPGLGQQGFEDRVINGNLWRLFEKAP